MANTVVDIAAIYHAPSLLIVSSSRVVHVSKDNVIENRTADQIHKSFVTIATLSRQATNLSRTNRKRRVQLSSRNARCRDISLPVCYTEPPMGGCRPHDFR